MKLIDKNFCKFSKWVNGPRFFIIQNTCLNMALEILQSPD